MVEAFRGPPLLENSDLCIGGQAYHDHQKESTHFPQVHGPQNSFLRYLLQFQRTRRQDLRWI